MIRKMIMTMSTLMKFNNMQIPIPSDPPRISLETASTGRKIAGVPPPENSVKIPGAAPPENKIYGIFTTPLFPSDYGSNYEYDD